MDESPIQYSFIIDNGITKFFTLCFIHASPGLTQMKMDLYFYDFEYWIQWSGQLEFCHQLVNNHKKKGQIFFANIRTPNIGKMSNSQPFVFHAHYRHVLDFVQLFYIFQNTKQTDNSYDDIFSDNAANGDTHFL